MSNGLADFVRSIDKPLYKKLYKAYNDAVILHCDAFKFQGQTLLVDYAKYLIEYLETRKDLQ